MTKQSPFPILALSSALLLGSAAFTNAVAQTQAASDSMTTQPNQAVSDTWITTKVKAELASTKGVKSTDVSVTTVDGLVTLTGVLPNKIAVKKAIAVARAVKGVKRVDASGLEAKD